jgi:hypothetical protein
MQFQAHLNPVSFRQKSDNLRIVRKMQGSLSRITDDAEFNHILFAAFV